MGLLDKLSRIFNRNSTGDLKIICDAMDNILSDVSRDITSLNTEYNLSTSSGVWLNEWGSWFIPRLSTESDEEYRARIVYVCLAPKCTVPALLSSALLYQQVKYGQNANVELYEDLAANTVWLEVSGDSILSDDFYNEISPLKSAGVLLGLGKILETEIEVESTTFVRGFDGLTKLGIWTLGVTPFVYPIGFDELLETAVEIESATFAQNFSVTTKLGEWTLGVTPFVYSTSPEVEV